MKPLKALPVGHLRSGLGFGRRVRAGLFALVVATTTAVFALPSPSMAAGDDFLATCSKAVVSCQTGLEVSGPPTATVDICGVGRATTSVCILFDGDYVYVKDGESDGHSALATVESAAGSVNYRHCRNPHGYGTWAKCNFNWAEPGTKYLSAGIRIHHNLVYMTHVRSWWEE